MPAIAPALTRQYHLVVHTFRWLILATLAGILAGSASALLLVSLNWATDTREAHRWIIALLPLAGLAIGMMYFTSAAPSRPETISSSMRSIPRYQARLTRRTVPSPRA